MASASAGRRAPARGKAKAAPRFAFGFGRWWKVALLVGLVMIGLPLAHAMFGEIGALLGGAVLFGFLLGRWTLR
ncbi:hypothetical protein [Falsiroseomonas sp. HW251]|uniref:hypothetical protein n=1 Tax=Falsiroseomonas sp. HW251 TaxID=3390998 RepID=UPI003D31F2C3